MHFDRRLAPIGAAVGGIILLAGCGALAKTAPPPTAAPTTLAQGLCAAAPTLCAAAATDTPAPAATPNDLTGPVGTAYTDTDSSGNVMTVTLTGMINPAHGADIYTTPDNGFYFVAAKFSITGVSGTSSDDANSDAAVIGSDSQTYSPDFSDVRGCTNFNEGEYSVATGATSVGCVVFQVPNGVTVASVQWGGGYGGTPAVWTI
jgi:hypothetical protein